MPELTQAEIDRRVFDLCGTTRESGGDGVGTMADLQRDRGPRSPETWLGVPTS
jgi:hypothetical protein